MIWALLLAQAVLHTPPATAASVSAASIAASNANASAQAAQAQAQAAMAMAQAAAAKAAGAVQTVNGLSPTSAGNVAIAIPAAPDLSGYATASSVTAAISAATSPLAKASDLASTSSIASAAGLAASAAQATANAACKAWPSVPPVELVGGSAGSSGTSCRPYDAAQPRITRAAVVTTDSGGGWAVTWASALPTVPVVLPVPVNATAEPVVCNVSARSATAAAGRCWYARMLPSTLTVVSTLAGYDLFGANASGISVQVLAIPPTQ